MRLTLLLVGFVSIACSSAHANDRNSQAAGTAGREKIRLEYRNTKALPNHLAFQHEIFRIRAHEEKNTERAVGIVQKGFGNVSTEEAEELLQKILTISGSIQEDRAASENRILCNNGAIRSKDEYYKRMDALDDAMISNIERHYILFLADLSDQQSQAFLAYLDSRKERIYFRTAGHKSTYESMNIDVIDHVVQVCANYGVSP